MDINYGVLDHKTEDDLLADIERKFQKIYTSLDPETSRVIEMLLKPGDEAARISPRGADDPFKIPEDLVVLPAAMRSELEKAQMESGMTAPDFTMHKKSYPQIDLGGQIRSSDQREVLTVPLGHLSVPLPDICQVPSPDYGGISDGSDAPPDCVLGGPPPSPPHPGIFTNTDEMTHVSNYIGDPVAAALEVAAAVEALEVPQVNIEAGAEGPIDINLSGGLLGMAGHPLLSPHFSELDVLKGLEKESSPIAGPAALASEGLEMESSLARAAEIAAPPEGPSEPAAVERAPPVAEPVAEPDCEPEADDAIEALTEDEVDEEAIVRAATEAAPEMADLTDIIKQADAAIAAADKHLNDRQQADADVEINKGQPIASPASDGDGLGFLPLVRDKTDLAMNSPRKHGNEQKTPEPPKPPDILASPRSDLLAKYLPVRRKTLIMQNEEISAFAGVVSPNQRESLKSIGELDDPGFDMPAIVRDKTDLAANYEEDTSPPHEDQDQDPTDESRIQELRNDPSDDLIARAWKVLGVEPESARSLSRQAEEENKQEAQETEHEQKGPGWEIEDDHEDQEKARDNESEQPSLDDDKAEDLLARAREVLAQPTPEIVAIPPPQQSTPVKTETTPSAEVDLTSEDGDGRNKVFPKSTRSDSVDSNGSRSSSKSRRRAQGFGVEMPTDLTYSHVKSPRPGLYTVPEGPLEEMPDFDLKMKPEDQPEGVKDQGGPRQGQQQELEVVQIQEPEEPDEEIPLTAFIDDALEKLKNLSGESPSLNEDADGEAESEDIEVASVEPPAAADPPESNLTPPPSGILREEPPLLSILMERTREEPQPVSMPRPRYRQLKNTSIRENRRSYKADSPKPVADPVFRLASPRKKISTDLEEPKSAAQTVFNPLPDWRPSVPSTGMRRASSYSRAAPTVPRRPTFTRQAKSEDLLDARTSAINRDLHLKVTKFTFCKGIKFARVLVRVENSLRHPVQLSLEPTGRITSAKVLCEGKGENPEFVLPRDEVYLMVEGTGILKVYAHAYRQRWSSATWRLCHQIPVPHEEDLERCRIKQSPKIFWAKLRRRPVAISDES